MELYLTARRNTDALTFKKKKKECKKTIKKICLSLLPLLVQLTRTLVPVASNLHTPRVGPHANTEQKIHKVLQNCHNRVKRVGGCICNG